MAEEQGEVYVIPDNYEDSIVTSNGWKMRNIIEACVAAAIFVIPVLFMLRIDFKFKIIILVFTALPTAFIFIRGHNNCSLVEFFMDYMRYRLGPKVFRRKPIFVGRCKPDKRKVVK